MSSWRLPVAPLDAPFYAIRRAYLGGHLTLRETTEQQNLEVWLRRSERGRLARYARRVRSGGL